MKMRPGIVTSAERRKYQRRLPMMSNTRSRLASQRRPPRRPGHELLLAHAVEGRLTRPVAADDDPQDRARDGDRTEHRDEDTDDEDEGEATDRRRAEEIEDRGGDEGRHVRVEDRVPGPPRTPPHRPGQGLAHAHLPPHPFEAWG